MKNQDYRLHTQRKNNQSLSSVASSTPVPGIFESRPFVVQQKQQRSSQQSDLKASLMGAERYGHHLARIKAAGMSTGTQTQAKQTSGEGEENYDQEGDRVISQESRINTPSSAQLTQGRMQEGHNEVPKVIQRNGDGQKEKEKSKVTGREGLGQDLFENIQTGGNRLASTVFKAMNFGMHMEGQPLNPEHEKVLRQKLIEEKAGVFDTLSAENPHVMNTNGSTPLYWLGKNIVHRPLQKWLNYKKGNE
ncbi:hypothetical protein H6G27_23055 [Nostoc linckia FACHB-104]|nr:hypothetical protein [Nostoc linckia FACHB-104]